ncbi:MAG: ABC transporter ATP-binding protein [Gammaproteobacteria bacterium]|jgi:ABC-2 type transport system ATP-binding protein|nr:ABC transporter ATP-binding protein [Gammaproteobacteria bacterium]
MTAALEIQDLRKTYANGPPALKGIDLTVAQGEFFALLGPNGAGKSTAIGIVSSLINKTGGKVFIFGRDIDTDFAAARRNIGLVPQEFNFNVFEPVVEIVVNQAGYYGIPRRAAFDAAGEVLNQLGLWNKRRVQARELSGGMKRRLMIARALIHQPRLLILDEPTAGVDIEIRRSMWEFLARTNEAGTTIILTTHYLEEAESLCRQIAIIDEGRIVEHSAMRDLLSRLHEETFVLYLKEPLEQLPELGGHELRLVDERTLEARVHCDVKLNDLFADLSHAGIDILSMKNKTNRLEEFFISRLANRGNGQ